MDVRILINIIQLYPKKVLVKNFFLKACYCLDKSISLPDLDQTFLLGWGIGHGLWTPFSYSKVFRVHAILHDAAEAVRLKIGSGSGYCYMIGRGPKSCLVGHVNGVVSCLYLKLFLPSNFKLIKVSNSLTFVVVDIELSQKN